MSGPPSPPGLSCSGPPHSPPRPDPNSASQHETDDDAAEPGGARRARSGRAPRGAALEPWLLPPHGAATWPDRDPRGPTCDARSRARADPLRPTAVLSLAVLTPCRHG